MDWFTKDALHTACENGNLTEVERIFLADPHLGTLPQTTEDCGLVNVINYGHKDIVRFLLSHTRKRQNRIHRCTMPPEQLG